MLQSSYQSGVSFVADKSKLPQYEFDITKTSTWQLLLEITEPDPEYVVGRDEQGNPVTNYAEHVDDVLYPRN
jgi:hypothetical protein